MLLNPSIYPLFITVYPLEARVVIKFGENVYIMAR